MNSGQGNKVRQQRESDTVASKKQRIMTGPSNSANHVRIERILCAGRKLLRK